MSPNNWGPPTWNLFHTLAATVKEDKYPIISSQLYGFISQICHNLPCPECSSHAKLFLSKINSANLKTKSDFKNMLYVFHNAVNKRKVKQMYKYESLDVYNSKNIILMFNDFAKHFNTNGNMKFISDNFHRKQLLLSLKKWLMQNVSHFEIST